MIHYPVAPTQKELIESLTIISQAKYCKVWWWEDGIDEYMKQGDTWKRFKYFKNGKLHREFKHGVALGFGMCGFYGYDGFAFEKDKQTEKELKNIERSIKIYRLNGN